MCMENNKHETLWRIFTAIPALSAFRPATPPPIFALTNFWKTWVLHIVQGKWNGKRRGKRQKSADNTSLFFWNLCTFKMQFCMHIKKNLHNSHRLNVERINYCKFITISLSMIKFEGNIKTMHKNCNLLNGVVVVWLFNSMNFIQLC